MKKLLILFCISLLLCGLTACNSPASPSGQNSPEEETQTAEDSITQYSSLEPVVLIGADSTGEGAAGQLLGECIAARLDEITGGQLTMSYHPNGELGGDTDLLRQMQNNDIQLVICQTAPVVSFIPNMAVFDLPMVFAGYDGDTIEAVLNGEDSAFRAALADAYQEAGLRLLGFLQNATYRLTTAHIALQSLEDFTGLQIRTMENTNHMDFWSAIGAMPTPLTWSEVYFALRSGAIDAQENAADTCVGANLDEVQEYLACTNHILYVNQICINQDAYAALDPLYQAALDQAVAEAIAEIRPQLQEIDQNNKDQLVANGMTMIEYDAAFFDQILALEGVKELYARIDTEQTDGLATLLQEELQTAAE